MFCNPDWFRLAKSGWGLWPTTWQGWGYAAVSPFVVSVPTLTFIALSLLPEALIWLAVSAIGWAWDVNKVVKEKRTKEDLENLYYIGDAASEQAVDASVSTENYDLRLRG